MKVLSTISFSILLIVSILFISHRLEKSFLGAKGALVVFVASIAVFVVSFLVDTFLIKANYDLEKTEYLTKNK